MYFDSYHENMPEIYGGEYLDSSSHVLICIYIFEHFVGLRIISHLEVK